MTPASCHQLPAIGFDQSDDFADFHVGHSQRNRGIVGRFRSTSGLRREMRDMIALRSFALEVAADEPELVGDAGCWSRMLMTMTPSGNGGH